MHRQNLPAVFRRPGRARGPSMTAREIAYDVLKRWKPQSAHAARALDEWFSRGEISAADRALATELVHGVMRRRDTLSALLKPHVNRHLGQVEAGALVLLWLGAYQLVLLSGIPPYAVVNEMVELAKRSGNPQWGRFINGVLRSLGRAVSDEFVMHPAASAVPLASGKYRVVRGDAFREPSHGWLGWFIAAFSLPRWLVERWQARFNRDELIRLGFWFNAPAKMCLRANRLRRTRDELLKALEGAGIKACEGTGPDAIRLE